MSHLPLPTSDNSYLVDHFNLLRRSLSELTGQDLVEGDPPPKVAARQIWEAPFFVASHNTAADPVLTYGNRCALELFEMTWEQFTSTHSRLTAEVPEQAERNRLLAEVSEQGYIENYSGIRISSTGRRFRIDRAIVWNLIDDQGTHAGQAAMFREWEDL